MIKHLNKALPTSFNKNVYFLLVVLAAIALRLFRLDFQSLYGDELYSIIPTHPANSLASVIEYSKSDQPPAYFIFLHTWFKLVPYNEYMGRLLSAIFGVFGVVAMYFLGVEFKNKQVGIFASFLTTFNYFHIYYSQEMRFYSLLFLFTTLSYLFFLKCLKSPAIYNYLLYCLFTISLIYTHYFGPVVVISQGIVFGVFVALGRRDWRFIVYSIISGIAILISYVPWLPVILKDTEIQSFWILKPSPLFFGFYYYLYLGKDPFLAALFLYFLVLFVRQFLKRNQHGLQDKETSEHIRDRFVLLVVWVITGYLIPYLYSILEIPILEARYTLIVLPALVIIFSLGLSTITSNKVKISLLAAVVISTVINLSFFNAYYFKIFKHQYREASAVVIANYQKPLKVFTASAYFYNYYLGKSTKKIEAVNPTTWYPGQSDSEVDFAAALANEQQVWILQGSPELPAVAEKQQAYLDEHFVPLKRFDFLGAYVVLYSRK